MLMEVEELARVGEILLERFGESGEKTCRSSFRR